MPRKVEHETVECEWCGREFVKTVNSRRRCCSPACYEQLRLEERQRMARLNARQRYVGFGISDPYADGRLRSDPLFCPVI